MSVSNNRKFTGEQVYKLLESVKNRTLGEVDDCGSRQFDRAERSSKITGIAGDIIEQSVFGYERDSRQECDIEIDGHLVELKTTGVRVPKVDLKHIKGLAAPDYYRYFNAKEGISITGVTFEPTIQTDFMTSHFWDKAERLLIVFYEYNSYEVVPANEYRDFKIVDYCYNRFSDEEKAQLKNDWEIVRDYLKEKYTIFEDKEERYEALIGFTNILRPNLLLIELVPGFKRKSSGSFQKPRYRLKKTFVDTIVRGHFNKSRDEVSLSKPFASFKELDARCHELSLKYKGRTLEELKNLLNINTAITTKDFQAKCVLKMFDANCTKLNQIIDFTRAGIIAKTITMTPTMKRKEDMKLSLIDFDEWADRDVDFEDSEVYSYFNEHSLLCPIFILQDKTHPEKSIFAGFKRFAFDDDFINKDVRKTWEDSRSLIHQNKLEWVESAKKSLNKSGSKSGAPNFPKSSEYTVFFRGGNNDSSEKSRTEVVNNIRMLPQFLWLKGSYIVSKLKEIPFL